MYCSECGKLNDYGRTCCWRCGGSLKVVVDKKKNSTISGFVKNVFKLKKPHIKIDDRCLVGSLVTVVYGYFMSFR